MSESNLPQIPWHAVEDEVHSHGQDSVVVAMTAPLAEFDHGVRCEVARLTAAGPDLLAAAKRALNVLKAQGESVRSGNALGALEAAIAKAEPRP